MKRIIGFFIVLLLVIANIQGSQDIGTPFSRYGINGGIDIPTAYILPHGNICYSHVLNFDTKNTYKRNNLQTFSLTIGLFNFLQANISYYQSHNLGLNFEALLLKEDKYDYIPSLAVGIENIGGSEQFTQEYEDYWNQFKHLNPYPDYTLNFERNTLYLVLGKRFVFGKQFIRLHLGFCPNAGRFYGMGPKSFYVKRTFYNLEYSPFYNLRFYWEQDARDWNFGARFIVNRMFSFHAAVTEVEHMDDWVGAAVHIGFSVYLVPNPIAIKQRKQEYDMLVQSRIEEANRLDQLYQETVRKRILLENKLNAVRVNVDQILAEHRADDRLLLYERELINESDYYVKMALELAFYGDLAKAKEYGYKAIEIFPRNPIAYLRLGEILIKSDKAEDSQEAIEVWKKGLLIDPQNPLLIEILQRHQK
ncbi:MAG: YjbH domain-containing protein [Candidatus Delongbacteria bacterium]|nr:YjbH domain-containing protein [Candidatus Delongbacteria bacterium]